MQEISFALLKNELDELKISSEEFNKSLKLLEEKTARKFSEMIKLINKI